MNEYITSLFFIIQGHIPNGDRGHLYRKTIFHTDIWINSGQKVNKILKKSAYLGPLIDAAVDCASFCVLPDMF